MSGFYGMQPISVAAGAGFILASDMGSRFQVCSFGMYVHGSLCMVGTSSVSFYSDLGCRINAEQGFCGFRCRVVWV